ncbi:MAG: D-glycero-beta-D-manno-heptose 1-phosphate adenylyltransferase [Bacteroidota bacterium]
MYSTEEKVLSLPSLIKKITSWRVNGAILVFTNGCFDILHSGHISYLESARKLGDKLIIGVNSDASVARLKGPSRPIQSEGSRARILAALECVEAVVLFEEDTPLDLIRAILPDILVKGGDYAIEEIVGHEVVIENGGEVRSLQFIEGASTTDIIQKIRIG